MSRTISAALQFCCVLFFASSYAPLAVGDWPHDSPIGGWVYELTMNPATNLPAVVCIGTMANDTLEYMTYDEHSGWSTQQSWTIGANEWLADVSLAFTSIGEPAILYAIHDASEATQGNCFAYSYLYYSEQVQGVWQTPIVISVDQYPVRGSLFEVYSCGYDHLSLAFDSDDHPVVAYSLEYVAPAEPPCTFIEEDDTFVGLVSARRRAAGGTWSAPASVWVPDDLVDKLTLRMDPLRNSAPEEPVIVFECGSAIMWTECDEDGNFLTSEFILAGDNPSLEFSPLSGAPAMSCIVDGYLHYATIVSELWQSSSLGCCAEDADLAFGGDGNPKVLSIYDEYVRMEHMYGGTWNGYSVADFGEMNAYEPQLVSSATTNMPYAGVKKEAMALYLYQWPRITIRAWDEDTGLPIPTSEFLGAVATRTTSPYTQYEPEESLTSSHEMYIIAIPAGTYYVSASAHGYKLGTQTVTLSAHDKVVVDIELTPKDGNGCGSKPTENTFLSGAARWKALLPVLLAAVVLSTWFLASKRAKSL